MVSPAAKPCLSAFMNELILNRVAGAMKAYVAVQKKLLTICYAIWKNNTDYDPMYYIKRVKELEKVVPASGTTQDVAA
jgi:transposase